MGLGGLASGYSWEVARERISNPDGQVIRGRVHVKIIDCANLPGRNVGRRIVGIMLSMVLFP